MERFCTVCNRPLGPRTTRTVCNNCSSRIRQKELRETDREAFNAKHNKYYHQNKEELSKYRQLNTIEHRKAGIYFAIYEKGLYIGSTYWITQRKGTHINQKGALHIELYELPYDTPKTYTRLLEAFLIHKLSPAANVSQMNSNVSKASITQILNADNQSNEIIKWAKSVPQLTSFIK